MAVRGTVERLRSSTAPAFVPWAPDANAGGREKGSAPARDGRGDVEPESSRPIHALFASKPAPATSSAIADAEAT